VAGESVILHCRGRRWARAITLCAGGHATPSSFDRGDRWKYRRGRRETLIHVDNDQSIPALSHKNRWDMGGAHVEASVLLFADPQFAVANEA
jgi:hypothetical protein